MSQALHAFYEFRALPYIMAQIGLRRPRVEVEQQEVPAGGARMVVLRPLVVHRPRQSFVFFVHPTGWPQNTPGFFRFAAHWFAERGFTVFLPGYRTPPQHPWPAPLEDLQQAMVVCQEMRPHLGLEEATVLVGGMGLGAQLAALLLFRERQAVDLEIQDVAGFFSLGGSLDPARCTLGPGRRMLDELAAEPEVMDPMPHVRGHEVPVLAIHGERDGLIDSECSRSFVQQAGGRLHMVPSAGQRDMARVFLQAREETRVLEHWLDDVDAG